MPGPSSVLLATAIVSFALAGCAGDADVEEGAREALCARAAEPAKTAGEGRSLRRHTVAIVREEGVYVGRADGDGLRRITDLPGFEYQPEWSPDGRRLLLPVDGSSPDDGRGGTYVVGENGKGARNLTRSLGIRGGSGDWSPDGERIVLVGARDGDRHANLYVAGTDGKSACRLTDDSFEAQYPSWSPDGRSIAFARPVGREDFDSGVITLGRWPPRWLTRGPEGDNWPEWSPDGRRIAFSRGDGDLWLIGADGSSPRRLTRGGEHAWTPDGRWIGYNCPAGLCAIRPDGSGETVLMRDGGFIAFKAGDDG